MGKVINMVSTECQPEVEAEFNKWYDEIHIPLLFKFKWSSPGGIVFSAPRSGIIPVCVAFPVFTRYAERQTVILQQINIHSINWYKTCLKISDDIAAEKTLVDNPQRRADKLNKPMP